MKDIVKDRRKVEMRGGDDGSVLVGRGKDSLNLTGEEKGDRGCVRGRKFLQGDKNKRPVLFQSDGGENDLWGRRGKTKKEKERVGK